MCLSGGWKIPEGEIAFEEGHLAGCKVDRPTLLLDGALGLELKVEEEALLGRAADLSRRAPDMVGRARDTVDGAIGERDRFDDRVERARTVMFGREIHEGFTDRFAEIGKTLRFGDVRGSPDLVAPHAGCFSGLSGHECSLESQCGSL